MKKILLIILFTSSGLFAQIQEIEKLFPSDRKSLAISMIGTAEAYELNGRMKKAKEYYKTALSIYPIGDKAHILAEKLGILLDDETTFSNFISSGDEASKKNQYQKALINYLMAKEIQEPVFIYKKLLDTYTELNDSENAKYYQKLIDEFNEPTKKETGELTTEETAYSQYEDDVYFQYEDDINEEFILDTENTNMNEVNQEYMFDPSSKENPDENMNTEIINALDETIFYEQEN